MIPKNKHDEETVALLRQATDDEVIEVAEPLLDWLKDRNWPIFDGVVARLSALGCDLVDPINSVFEGDDSIWKANIIAHLIPAFSYSDQQLYVEALEKLIATWDENDLREGVIDLAEVQLANVKKGLFANGRI
jgi:hypothetical protein